MNALVRAGYRSAHAVTRRHAKSFSFASHLLFGARRRAAFALYAFCRRLDDLVDESPPHDVGRRLALARVVTSSVFRGELDTPEVAAVGAFDPGELAALADTVARYQIPEQPMQDLISGMEMDLAPRRYASWSELEVYCYRAAGTVGLLMAPVLGCSSDAALVQAADLGRAMQLTNILRDVGEDLERGRVYLPLDELSRFGLTEADLHARRADERFAAFMAFQCTRARALYRSGMAGIPMLRAFGAGPMVRVMSAVYRGILRAIEHQRYDVFHTRAYVPLPAKVGLAAGALLRPAA
ncbi:MAG: phytoene/squalene synthase family protein [Archangium sp.]|nr:phytoene/squalene synthase family protein [Archangium sp.]